MPRKSEDLRINNPTLDKRVKILEEDKTSIKLKHRQGESLHSLAREYQVDRKTIRAAISEEYKKQELEKHKEYRKKYYIDKATRNKYMTKHRNYKEKLYKEGKIKWK